jgi:hypothetical protein
MLGIVSHERLWPDMRYLISKAKALPRNSILGAPASRRLVCRRDGGVPRCHRLSFLLRTPWVGLLQEGIVPESLPALRFGCSV